MENFKHTRSMFKIAKCLKCNKDIYDFKMIGDEKDLMPKVQIECCKTKVVISVPRICIRNLA